MEQIKKLTPTMMNAIELYVNNPGLTPADIARELGKHYNTVWNWFDSPIFKEEIDRRLKERWEEASKEAQHRMIMLMRDANEQTAYNAAKYILDANGFKPEDKLSISGNMDVEINIVDD